MEDLYAAAFFVIYSREVSLVRWYAAFYWLASEK